MDDTALRVYVRSCALDAGMGPVHYGRQQASHTSGSEERRKRHEGHQEGGIEEEVKEESS
jgi:hypothetical protein